MKCNIKLVDGDRYGCSKEKDYFGCLTTHILQACPPTSSFVPTLGKTIRKPPGLLPVQWQRCANHQSSVPPLSYCKN